jgi:cytochrome c
MSSGQWPDVSIYRFNRSTARSLTRHAGVSARTLIMKSRLFSLSASMLLCATSLATHAAENMEPFARNAGCFACHHIDAGAKGPNGLPPIGPAWRDVANKYRGNPDAEDALTHTVMTGSNPYASHWKGKVSGLAMPPNAAVISETDARRLVHWILALPATPESR